MAVKSWKAEFYPVDAYDVAAKDAVQHSLQKWIGLRPENLKKHRLKLVGRLVRGRGETVVSVSSNTCALCIHYVSRGCAKCPLALHLGARCDYSLTQPYQVWDRTGDPEPMIAALTAILPKEQP